MRATSAAQERVDQRILDERHPSVAHLFRDRVHTSGGDLAYQYFVGEDLVDLSWDETADIVWMWAAGLMALGLQVEDRVAIASGTRFEWVLADLAIMCSGGATTTIYPSTIADDVGFIMGDSGSSMVFAEDAAQVAKLRDQRDKMPGVTKVICFDPAVADGDWVISTDDLVALGDAVLEQDEDAVDARIDQLGPDNLATIIYTSGTTGRPKGAELTHDCFVWVGASAAAVDLLRRDDVQFLWLPLSHVFGKVLLTIPLQVGFPTAVDGRLDKIVDNLAIVRPTFMGAAPRIFEKVKAKVGMTFDEATGVKAHLISWALGVGRQVAERRQSGAGIDLRLGLQHALADRLVLSKVRARFGGRIRFFISGSAPLDPEVAWWFATFGLLICEGYGLTETSAYTTINRPHVGGYQFGTIGWPAAGTDVRVADDGELLIKGPGVMRGYHNDPAATAAVFTQDGYFCSGDIGQKDDRGFIRVTDRKKDVFKTSGGKYVAPAHIEAQFKGLCPYVSQFLVIGEGKNYASALVTLDAEAIAGWAEKNGLAGRPYAEIVTSPAARALVKGYIDELNSGLNRWETIKDFSILERDLSIENEELTPSMKLRRRVVLRNFDDQIKSLYGGTGVRA